MNLENRSYDANWSVADHQSSRGKSFSRRYEGLTHHVAQASDEGLWQYFRTHDGRVAPRSTVRDEKGRPFQAVNLGSQDYLGLASHPEVHRRVISAIEAFGVHSSGSAPMGGGSAAGIALQEGIAMTLGVQNALLFPTGWAAGYGAIKGIVRPHDYIVMDALAHNCLQHGAQAATGNVSVFIHNSPESLEKRLQRIRRKDPEAAILVVFESLYSMDSDCPPIAELTRIARQYHAHTLVDIAHDFGILGSEGKGLLAENGGYGSVDLIIGSFSKVFGAIGGFVASNDLNLIRAVQGFSGSYTFSNFLTPPQIAAAQAALEIAFSPEGDRRRSEALRSCRSLRGMLEAQGLETFGIDSGMVIIKVGREASARQAYRQILANGVIVNCIEFPAVRKGEARFRIQLTPEHSADDLLFAAGVIGEALNRVNDDPRAEDISEHRCASGPFLSGGTIEAGIGQI